MNKLRIAIIGATGYTGSELVRILINHPQVEIRQITSESRAGDLFSEVHPFFKNICDQRLESIAQIDENEIDLAFLALPHGVSMDFVKKFHHADFKIVDLSGDFRLDSAQTYEEWYKKDHCYAEGIESAVYGLPELFLKQIKDARLVANPGCFPTGAVLGLAPVVAAGIVNTSQIIVDAKTGVTGAGIKSKPVNLFSNVNDNFKAYGLKNHRHTIEIQGTLARLCKNNVLLQFTPHLLPVDRGILSTIYVRPQGQISEEVLTKTYEDFYAEQPFIRVVDSAPALKDVRGTNRCDVFATYDARTELITIITVIDNLGKGAAGQAVQNMNIMSGFAQAAGLHQIPLSP